MFATQIVALPAKTKDPDEALKIISVQEFKDLARAPTAQMDMIGVEVFGRVTLSKGHQQGAMEKKIEHEKEM
jgi:hypothetical protein